MFKRLTPMAAIACMLIQSPLYAQKDTVRLMSYNVLNYGEAPNCQGAVATYHGHLKTVTDHVRPDLLSLVKMGAVKTAPTDPYGNAPYGFGDSILKYVLNVTVPGKYAYCSFTNNAHEDNINMLFYNQQKMGFSGIVLNYVNITDFNCYKLYYKDPDLALTHDTTFLYVIVNHTKSGDNEAATRGAQVTQYMQQIAAQFQHLPNMVNMGDFNTRNTNEVLYQKLVNPADTNYRFFEPAFYPDAVFTYPLDYDNDPEDCLSFLTTSTRKSSSQPNSCGTSGGGKGWYDHIFLSSWIINNAKSIRYMPNTYKVIGNDGHREGISINDNSTYVNNSAPSNVINAIYQMSNKYPIVADLELTQKHPTAGIKKSLLDEVYVENPAGSELHIHIPATLQGKDLSILVHDISGRTLLQQTTKATSSFITTELQIVPGTYIVTIVCGQEQKNYSIIKQ